MKERTFVMIKPDGVERSLIGEIIARFERAGLKVVALKMFKFDKELAEKFYPTSEEWFEKVGQKTKKSYEEFGLNVKEHLGTDDEKEIGKIVKKWLVEFVCSKPVVGMVLEGNRAVEIVRKIVGHTFPYKALPGTIRGDYSLESPELANLGKRAVKNLIHASDSKEEAEREIKTIFKEDEIFDYKNCLDRIYG
ncbi:MAG: nucleoside-diphosphate kinase [Candidatus Aenigmarchaeota archaeon ex4484_224]|nr:MAG: nucleoside-diphosphate kinase [Candidatus Aenigmarchaeota archaeon ex4484_224]